MRPTGHDRGSPSPLRRFTPVLPTVLVVVSYALGFYWLYDKISSGAFILGFVPVLTAAATLGIRGALVTVLVVALVDRTMALSIGPERQDGILAGLLSLAAKTAVAVSVGGFRTMSLRLRKVNAELEHEVSVRRQLAASLEQNSELHRSLVTSMGEGVVVCDPDGHVLFANGAAERLLPEVSPLVGANLDDWLYETRSVVGTPTTEPPAGPCTYQALLGRSNPKTVLITETRLAGASETEPRALRVLRDITAHARLEREQRELEVRVQRTQALQSLAVLAGGVAHDFNNLLSGVIGNAELALLKLPKDAPPAVVTSLEEIKGFAREASELSRQMLAYAGKRALTLEPVDLGAEVSDLTRLMATTIANRATLKLDLARDLPKVRADRVQLRQVVMNLVLNGLESMSSARGELVVATRVLTLDGAGLQRFHGSSIAPGTFVVLMVQDTGSGMSEDTKHHIFEPFFSTKFAGRGMGLAATLGIVKAHHGAIAVDSEPGRGSTFEVIFPPSSPMNSQRLLRPLLPAGATVLLVDDELAVRSVTSKLLEELGYRVLLADDGARAIEVLSKNAVDLVLLDLVMPNTTGAQALAELRRLRPELPFLLTSGYHPEDVTELMRQPNVLGFVQKPHTLSTLSSALCAPKQRSATVSA